VLVVARLLIATAAASAVSLALAGLSPASAVPQKSLIRSTKVGDCLRAVPTRLPAFSASGAWAKGGGELMLLDNMGRTVLRYTPEGDSIGEVLPSNPAYLKRSFPTKMSAHKDGFILQVHGNQLDVLDRTFRRQRIVMATAASSSEAPLVDKVFMWTVLTGEKGEEVVAFADVKLGERSWWTGFVRFPLGNPAAVELIQTVDHEERTFYRITYPYIAKVGKTAYILRMDNQMGLYRVEAGENGRSQLKPLRSFEEIYRFPSLSPQLPIFRQPEDFAVVMRRVEHSSMPAGLYAWNGFLYVLSRQPRQGSTQWSLSKINPASDEYMGTATLSSVQANHVSLVPGPHKWAAIEKGPVKGLTAQEVKSLFLIPAATNERAPLRGDLCRQP